MSSALKLINTQLGLGVVLLLLLLLMSQEGDTRPMGHNEASYDASLDPLVWSLPFVQDKVRKHRIATPPNPFKQRHVHSPALPCAELGKKRRRQHSMKRYRNQLKYHTKSNSNYRKYLHRRRKLLLLQTRC
ncbi:hypothetical protein KR093_008815 [Drosophila rubida]|uniref:Uncharacterized protein n=1 Tax=Drosophila rubida TaxID=30044 RepID=A0AAD4PL49_9MUSC|nr:hypothetical protein KR093_008815 [Drosophila rubida]